MTRKPKSDAGPTLPPHRSRPLLVANDKPFEVLDLPHGLGMQLHGPAPGTCTQCRRPAPRLTLPKHRCWACDPRQLDPDDEEPKWPSP